jgi:hypothetical protein
MFPDQNGFIVFHMSPKCFTSDEKSPVTPLLGLYLKRNSFFY